MGINKIKSMPKFAPSIDGSKRGFYKRKKKKPPIFSDNLRNLHHQLTGLYFLFLLKPRLTDIQTVQKGNYSQFFWFFIDYPWEKLEWIIPYFKTRDYLNIARDIRSLFLPQELIYSIA